MGLFNWVRRRKAIKERLKFKEETSKDDPYWNELSSKEKKLFAKIVSDSKFNQDIEEFKKKNPKEYEKIITEFDEKMESEYGLVRKEEDFKKWKRKKKKNEKIRNNSF